MLLTSTVRWWVLVAALSFSPTAFAQRDTTREALTRVSESLSNRRDDGVLPRALIPAIVVSVKPAFEESKASYAASALKTLIRVFTADGLRSCEACMAPRVYMSEGYLEENSADLTTEEIARLDATVRGTGAPAKTAIWLDETPEGVSLRIISLENGRIILAENFDRSLKESAESAHSFNASRELERRAKNQALAHVFLDAAVYPGQHVSLDFSEQWGDTNANISGLSISFFDPLLGIGGSYFRVIPQALNLMVGAKILISMPTALTLALSQNSGATFIDPLFTGVLMLRMPISTSNFAIIASLSTNGRFGLGISLLNVSFLPVLP